MKRLLIILGLLFGSTAQAASFDGNSFSASSFDANSFSIELIVDGNYGPGFGWPAFKFGFGE